MKKRARQVLNRRRFCQVGLVVRDIERSSRAWAEVLGVKVPKWAITDTVDKAHTKFRGKSTKARAKLAFFQIGTISLELIEPVGGPSTWREFLAAKGEGVHHVAFMTGDMDATVAALKKRRMPAVQRGDYTGGCYGYIGTEKKLGVILELLQNV